MGQVLPFIARVRDSGDWSAAERARLEALADHLAAGGADVEVIFGATDEGDPWCVVTDKDGDVLIHVARIGGKFVVHSALDDTVDEGFDLHEALRERLAVTEDLVAPKSATVLPFTPRQGQGLLALVVAAAFFYETAGAFDEAQAAEPPRAAPHEDPAPPPPPAADAPSQDRDLPVQAAVLKDHDATPVAAPAVAETPAAEAPAPVEDAPAPPPPAPESPPAVAPTPAAAPPPAPEAPVVVIRGGDADDLLVGTRADERLEGGAGNDTLQGGGGHDTLLGGAGDDRIELADQAVAEGGSGADTFVVAAPAAGGHPETLLGVVLDFSFAEGDCIVTEAGRKVDVPREPPKEPPKEPPGQTGGPPVDPSTTSDGFTINTKPFAPPTPTGDPPIRVEVDFDGDGVGDGYLLVTVRDSHAAPPPPHAEEHPPITVTGETLGPVDLFS